MSKLDEILKKNTVTDAQKAHKEQQAAINSPGTHKDGNPSGQVAKENIPAEGQDVVVKNTVITNGNKDNKVTAAVVNEAANTAPSSTLAPIDSHMSRVQNAAGSAYLEGSIETVAADGMRMESSAQPMIVAEAEPSSAARTSNIATGFEVGQTAAEKHYNPIAGVLETEPLSAEVEENLRAKSKGVYESHGAGLRRYFRADGTAREAKNGLFYAEDDQDVKELDHFVKTGRVIKR